MKSANLRRSCLLALLLLSSFAFTQKCQAQVRRYRPSSPTVSPYLNLTRTNTSSLPNYYSLVRPMQVQRAINQQEQAIRKSQAGALIRLRNDVQVGLRPITPTGKSSNFFDPGRTYNFRGRSSYYRDRNAIHRGR